MKVISARMRGALVDAGASDATAEDAAADIGELAGEVRVIKWMVSSVLALNLLMLAALFQIAIRLP